MIPSWFRRWRDRRALAMLGFHEVTERACPWCGQPTLVKTTKLGYSPCQRCGRLVDEWDENWVLLAEWSDGCRVKIYAGGGWAVTRRPDCALLHESHEVNSDYWLHGEPDWDAELELVQLAHEAMAAPRHIPADPENAWLPGDVELPHLDESEVPI